MTTRQVDATPSREQVPRPGAPTQRGRAANRAATLVINGCFALLLVGVAVVHLLVLRRNGEPSGLDFGNWLTIGHRWLGEGAPGGSTTIYPPLVPLLVVAGVKLLGLSLGTAVVATLAGLTPAVATFFVISRSGSVAAAAVAGIVIAAAGSTGEAMAWGGMPQLFALGFALCALWSFADLLTKPSNWAAWRTGFLLFAVAFTSHLIFAQVAVSLVAVLVLHLSRRSGGASLRGPWLGRNGLLMHTLRVSAPLVLLVPLYLSLTRSVGNTFVNGAQSASPFRQTLDAFSGLFAEAALLWEVTTVLALLAPIVLLRRRADALWIVTAAILYPCVITIAVTGQARLAYLAPLGVVTGMAMVAGEVSLMLADRPRKVFAVAACVVAAFAAQRGLDHFTVQRTFYGERLVPSGTTAALDWVRTNTPRKTLIAVAPEDALPFGWWVEGYGHRATLTGASEAYLNFPNERVRARQATELFSLPSRSTAQFAGEVRQLGVRYIYVPAGWRGLAGSALQSYIDAEPTSVVFHNGAALIVRAPSA